MISILNEKLKNDMLNEHIPYRLTQLDGLCWASEELLKKQLSDKWDITKTSDASTKIELTDVRQLTNPLMETGLIHCRQLLNFLGFNLAKNTGQLEEIKRPGKNDDFSIVKLKLDQLTLAQLRSSPTGLPNDIENACQRSLFAINKGVAHFTDSNSGRSVVNDALLCANTIIWLIEEYVYRKLSHSVPPYTSWTGLIKASELMRS
ncbi:MAG: hypothetical protein ABSB19_15765 [Methylomonas sp.]|jgi:hypothetical protein